jgi:F420-dependent oxidoreductase-like protein
MRLGLDVNNFTWPGGDAAIGPTFACVVKRAEDAGFYSAWVMDHFYQLDFNGPPEAPMLEAYSALSYAAGLTSRIKLGAMVTGVTYRYPGIFVKTATTLDVLSGGRAYFGIGAAWFEREHHDMGVPYPPLGERFELLEETVQLALQMWSGETKPFNTKHFQLPEPICRPLPVSKPHPPILIGGGGEKKTLRLVAQYGDACNLFDGPEVSRKLEILREHCVAVGRSYEEIEKTVMFFPGSDLDGVASKLEELAGLGFDQAIASLPKVNEPGVIEAFAELAVPVAEGLVTAGRQTHPLAPG